MDVSSKPSISLLSPSLAVSEPNNANFVKEYRTNTNAFAIRNTFKDGTKEFKRRIIELKHRDTSWYRKEELATMAAQVLGKVRHGETEPDVVAWAKDKLKEKDWSFTHPQSSRSSVQKGSIQLFDTTSFQAGMYNGESWVERMVSKALGYNGEKLM